MGLYCPPLIPTQAAIKAGILSTINGGPYILPSLPTLPSPIYPNINSIDIELDDFIGELQNSQFLTTTKLITLPITGFLGLNFDAIMPTVPGTPFSLATIINGNLTENLDFLKTSLQNPSFVSTLGASIPMPMFDEVSSPDMEALMIYQHISKEAISIGIPTITGFISSVVNELEIGGLGSVPAIPTMSSIKAEVLSLFPDLSAEMPNVKFAKYSIQQKIKSYTFDTYTFAAISPIYNFCIGPLSSAGLSFTITPLCVSL